MVSIGPGGRLDQSKVHLVTHRSGFLTLALHRNSRAGSTSRDRWTIRDSEPARCGTLWRMRRRRERTECARWRRTRHRLSTVSPRPARRTAARRC